MVSKNYPVSIVLWTWDQKSSATNVLGCNTIWTVILLGIQNFNKHLHNLFGLKFMKFNNSHPMRWTFSVADPGFSKWRGLKVLIYFGHTSDNMNKFGLKFGRWTQKHALIFSKNKEMCTYKIVKIIQGVAVGMRPDYLILAFNFFFFSECGLIRSWGPYEVGAPSYGNNSGSATGLAVRYAGIYKWIWQWNSKWDRFTEMIRFKLKWLDGGKHAHKPILCMCQWANVRAALDDQSVKGQL